MAEEVATNDKVKKGLILPASKEARLAVESMNTALREVYEDVRRKLTTLTVHDVMLRWEIGRAVDRVLNPPVAEGDEDGAKKNATYGDGAIDKLAAAFGMGTSTLYSARNFACAFEREDLEGLLKERNIVGRPVSYSDLREVATLSRPSQRQKLIKYFFSNDVGWREMRIRAQEMVGGGTAVSRSTKGGLTAPRSPLAGLRALSRQAAKFQASRDVLSAGIFTNIDSVDGKSAAQVVEELTTAEETLSQIRESLDGDLLMVANAIKTLTQAAQADDSDEPAPAATKKVVKRVKPRVLQTAGTEAATESSARKRRPAPAASGVSDAELFAS